MPRWVTVFGRVNHLSAVRGAMAPRPTQPEFALCAGCNEYLAKAGGQAYRVKHQPVRVAVVSQCSLMPGWWMDSGD